MKKRVTIKEAYDFFQKSLECDKITDWSDCPVPFCDDCPYGTTDYNKGDIYRKTLEIIESLLNRRETEKMSNEEAIDIYEKFVQCNNISSLECKMNCDTCPYDVSDEQIDKAMAIAFEVLRSSIGEKEIDE